MAGKLHRQVAIFKVQYRAREPGNMTQAYNKVYFKDKLLLNFCLNHAIDNMVFTSTI